MAAQVSARARAAGACHSPERRSALRRPTQNSAGVLALARVLAAPVTKPSQCRMDVSVHRTSRFLPCTGNAIY